MASAHSNQKSACIIYLKKVTYTNALYSATLKGINIIYFYRPLQTATTGSPLSSLRKYIVELEIDCIMGNVGPSVSKA